MRLKITAAPTAVPPRATLEFLRLKPIVAPPQGNLGAHIQTLEGQGYVEVEKDFVGKKPRTRVRLSKSGRRAFEDYVAYLREIVGEA